MPVLYFTFRLSMHGNFDVRDITGTVESLVVQSNLKDGIVTIFCPSSTSGLTTIEYEPGCLEDLKRYFEEVADSKREYAHNARWGDGNGFSHLRAAVLGPSLTIPFHDGMLIHGTWQQIIYIDFDTRPRNRELVVQVFGE